MKQIIVTGGFDDLRSRHIRLLEEASKLGELHVLLWSDNLAAENDSCSRTLYGCAGNAGVKPAATGFTLRFPEAERLYMVQAIRYVSTARIVNDPRDTGPIQPDVWVNEESLKLDGFPVPPPMPSVPGRKKVVVTGCYDWFHSGHVRFFEEVSQLGDLYVCIGNDANVALLKGDGHPLFSQDERRYIIGSIRYVKECRINTGTGWLDAEPEIDKLKPDIYAVNEDGDRPEKREFCAQHGIQYVVLKRTPKEGLTKRSSTDLRGF